MAIFSVILVFVFIAFIAFVIITSKIQAEHEKQERMQRRYIKKKMEEDEDIE